MKQCINTQKVNEVNHIDVSNCNDYQEFEVNEAHIRNPNYKCKDYDPNYQKNKHKNNFNNSSSNSSNSGYKNTHNNNNNNNHNGGNFKNNRGDYTEMPSNVQVTLTGPVNQDQLAKIKKKILKNPRVYKDKLPKNQYPATGEYAKSFSKFCPTKVEVNVATVEDVIQYGHYIKKSEPKMAEAIDIYKALGNDAHYGPEEQPTEPQSQQEQ